MPKLPREFQEEAKAIQSDVEIIQEIFDARKEAENGDD